MTEKKTSLRSAATGAQVTRDAVSFQKPLDEARARCTVTLTTMVTKVSGTEAEIHAATADYHALTAFDAAFAAHAAAASFQDLPAVRSWRRRMPGFHQLRVGPFRGVFLVGQNPHEVVALVFSRKPHEMVSRLRELADRYASTGEGKEPAE